MCLILIAHQHAKERPLLVLANRDEFYERPTQAAGPWEEYPGLIAGRDLASGGSWFGARGSRWASVTNVREGFRHGHNSRSRGWLVRDYLAGDQPPPDFLKDLARESGEYAGFNLLLAEGDELWYGSNRGPLAQPLSPGIYGLSNHLLDTPWPKVQKGKAALTSLLSDKEFNFNAAFSILTDPSRAAEAELPDTGIPREWERALSAAFIHFGQYGTRSSTVLTKTADGEYQFIERSYEEPVRCWQERSFTWQA